MNYKLKITEEAFRDINMAFEYYENKQKNLGNQFFLDLAENIKYLIKNPEIFRIRKKDLREVVLNKFPYVVVFRIRKNVVVILAVFNTKQNPSKKP